MFKTCFTSGLIVAYGVYEKYKDWSEPWLNNRIQNYFWKSSTFQGSLRMTSGNPPLFLCRWWKATASQKKTSPGRVLSFCQRSWSSKWSRIVPRGPGDWRRAFKLCWICFEGKYLPSRSWHSWGFHRSFCPHPAAIFQIVRNGSKYRFYWFPLYAIFEIPPSLAVGSS